MTRSTLQGAAQILRFNWPLYAISLLVIVVATVALLASWVTGSWRLAAWVVLLLTAWWTAASLLASHWVYDHSRLYRFDWLHQVMPDPPHDWIHLHAGLDESTPLLEQRFGVAPRGVFDFFHADHATEPSIARAREDRHADPRTEPIDLDALPLHGASCDAVFSVFSAHEVRDAAARVTLFHEMARVLRADGSIVLVEHLRDLPNLVAFGPGCLHFLSRATWRQAASAAGLVIERELAVTPWVRALVLRISPCSS